MDSPGSALASDLKAFLINSAQHSFRCRTTNAYAYAKRKHKLEFRARCAVRERLGRGGESAARGPAPREREDRQAHERSGKIQKTVLLLFAFTYFFISTCLTSVHIRAKSLRKERASSAEHSPMGSTLEGSPGMLLPRLEDSTRRGSGPGGLGTLHSGRSTARSQLTVPHADTSRSSAKSAQSDSDSDSPSESTPSKPHLSVVASAPLKRGSVPDTETHGVQKSTSTTLADSTRGGAPLAHSESSLSRAQAKRSPSTDAEYDVFFSLAHTLFPSSIPTLFRLFALRYSFGN